MTRHRVWPFPAGESRGGLDKGDGDERRHEEPEPRNVAYQELSSRCWSGLRFLAGVVVIGEFSLVISDVAGTCGGSKGQVEPKGRNGQNMIGTDSPQRGR
jgi:hypothetical protein